MLKINLKSTTILSLLNLIKNKKLGSKFQKNNEKFLRALNFSMKYHPFTAALLEAANQLCLRQDDGTFACLTCERPFSNQSNCKRHIRLEHLGEDKNATCPNCEKQVLRTDIKRHMKKHCANRHLYVENTQYGY